MTLMNSIARPVLVAVGTVMAAAGLKAADRHELEVRETAGIRRFGYPVSAELKLPEPAPPATRFRLLHQGKPIPAQVRPISGEGGRAAGAVIDFAVSHLPHESRRYTLELGPEVPPGPEPAAGMAVSETDDAFRVANRTFITWMVPKDLAGLLRSVKTSAGEFLLPQSPGLLIRTKEGAHRLGGSGTKSRISRAGAVACGLHFEPATTVPGVRASVTMEFPQTKSWAEVTCTLEDPAGRVTGLDADLHLHLEGERPLIDFGAGSLVYMALLPGQEGALEAGSSAAAAPDAAGQWSWRTWRGPANKPEPFVFGPASGPGALAEGWVHVMDQRLCTALAVADFGRQTRDRIQVSAAGRLQVARDFADPGQAAPKARKGLKFWIHFVPMPMHVGAATSPQAMQTPLQVRWLPAAER